MGTLCKPKATRHYEVTNMAIILRLDRMMADRKISLNDLAAKVGIANVNLSNIKTGKISAIRFSTLDAICDVLDCQPGDILEYKRTIDETASVSMT
jgi:putative transcriptional regulator